jgi:hypothetical protein
MRNGPYGNRDRFWVPFNVRTRVLCRRQRTVKVARAVARAALGDVHATSTGYVPKLVLPPTSHVQDTAPAAVAVFGPRPCAELGPLL